MCSSKKNVFWSTNMFEETNQTQERYFIKANSKKVQCSSKDNSTWVGWYGDRRYRKKKRTPQYTVKQMEEVPTRARRLYPTLLSNDFQLIMDDEKYFILTNESVSTNRGFYTSDRSITPSDVKFKRTQKYCTKVLVWIAISENGISKPFFSKQAQAINEITYLKHCIKARLMSFIKTYHNKENILFWPDLATSHYAESVISFLEEQNINVVPKEKKSSKLSPNATGGNDLANSWREDLCWWLGKSKRSTS